MGQERSECPQGTHAAKWPHGIQATALSSDKQSTHGFVFDSSSLDFSVGRFCLVALPPDGDGAAAETLLFFSDTLIGVDPAVDWSWLMCSIILWIRRSIFNALFHLLTCWQFFAIFSHGHTWYNDVLFLPINAFNLFLQYRASHK